jgi:hypothetical protein
MTTQTLPELDADLVERTAKAIGRARLLTEYPNDPVTISEDGYALYFRDAHASYRLALRQQAIAVLRASLLLERVAELERAISTAHGHLMDLDAPTPSVEAARARLNRAMDSKP